MTVKSRMRDRLDVISSTMPSARASALGSPDMLSKARTAIEGRAWPLAGRDTLGRSLIAGSAFDVISGGVQMEISIGSSLPLRRTLSVRATIAARVLAR